MEKDFNTGSFINYRDFVNHKRVIDRIIELDSNDKMYEAMMAEYWYKHITLPSCVDNENDLANFRRMFSAKGTNRLVEKTFRKHLYSFNLHLNRVDEFLYQRLNVEYRKFRESKGFAVVEEAIPAGWDMSNVLFERR